MQKPVSVRLDDEALRALARLEATGLSRSEAIRQAIVDAARRLDRHSSLAAEVAALEADEHDRREMAVVLELMEALSAEGDVVRIAIPKGVGHEQHGRRRAVVLQSDGMRHRSTLLVAPTSQSARPASFRPEIVVEGERTRVLVEHLRAVDIARLGEVVGRLTPDEQWGVDTALMTVLDLR